MTPPRPNLTARGIVFGLLFASALWVLIGAAIVGIVYLATQS
jgi:hypothetical protein